MEKKLWSMSMDRRGPPRNPQRPYARPAGGTCGKIWSDLYGDMQRPAEMTGPLGGSICPFPFRGKVRMGVLPLTLILSRKGRGDMNSAPKGAGHFCRPLHVAMQIGPYLPARSASGSGVWSLRIPRRSTPVHGHGPGLFSQVFPADNPHRTHCHQLTQIRSAGSAGYTDFPAYSQILQRP